MIKNRLIFAAVILVTVFSVTGDDFFYDLVFIGYDEQIPVFRYAKYNNNGGGHQTDSCVYKFVNGKLINTNISIAKGTTCMLIKNGVYVFKETLDSLTRFQFKRNGKTLISQSTLKWRCTSEIGSMAMNNEYFFVIAQDGDSSIIFRMKYMAPTKIDTIIINGYCTNLLDATNDFLYYSTEGNDEGEMMGPVGNVYRLSINGDNNSMILKEVYTLIEAMAIAADVNLIYVSVNSNNGIKPLLADYSKRKYTVSPDNGSGVDGVFYSYAYGAFIIYQHSLDMAKWKCLYPNEATEWKSLTNQPLRIREKPTGPKYKTGCVGGLAK